MVFIIYLKKYILGYQGLSTSQTASLGDESVYLNRK